MTLQLNDFSLLKTQAYIDGEWTAGRDGSTLEVTNPATGEVVATIASVGAQEAQAAIDAAEKALKPWQQKTARERSQLLRRWFDLIMENQEDLALIMTAEQGKPLFESRGEIAYAASFIEWFAEEAKRVYGDITPTVASDRRLLTIKQPVGVVAAITPWNFPSAMLTRKAAPALAVGCTFVMKPAKETPLSAMALVELAHRAGIPKGVLNLVVGESSRAIGGTLTASPVVRKLTFTGSTPVGKQLLKSCADTVKKVSMELGGNAPVIVFDDADIDKAVAGAIASKYRNAGQTCICANRILVQTGIYDRFAEKFAEAVRGIKTGNGMEQDTTMGPLVNAGAARDVDAMVKDAIEQGASALVGGSASELGECFYPPTVLTNVSEQMRVFREEIFGPVAPLFRFEDEAQAIAMANDTEFGLASYIYTNDLGRAWRVSEAIEYGMVGVNEVAITSEVIPFGGVKESGMGREGSRYGVEDYLEIKYICMGGLL
ncbi:MAG: NAD-dependent succinate-semialdehyde dehydrogenase [Amphritea sp.]